MDNFYMKSRHLGEQDLQISDNDDNFTNLEVRLIVYGSPEHKDLHGTYFTPNTYFGDEYGLPIKAFFGHLRPEQGENRVAPTREEEIRRQVIGKAEFLRDDETGRWYRIQVDKRKKYHDAIVALAKQGMLGASTGAHPYGAVIKEDGQITSWVEAEASLTPSPVNYESAVVLLKSLDIDVPYFADLEALERETEEKFKGLLNVDNRVAEPEVVASPETQHSVVQLTDVLGRLELLEKSLHDIELLIKGSDIKTQVALKAIASYIGGSVSYTVPSGQGQYKNVHSSLSQIPVNAPGGK